MRRNFAMKYPEEFKKKVLDLFNNDPEMKDLLDRGSSRVGTELLKKSSPPSVDIILKYFSERRQQDLLAECEKLKKYQELNKEWYILWQKQGYE